MKGECSPQVTAPRYTVRLEHDHGFLNSGSKAVRCPLYHAPALDSFGHWAAGADQEELEAINLSDYRQGLGRVRSAEQSGITFMIWRVYWKGGSSRKHYISGQLWNGKPVRLPGYSDEERTKDLMRNIESLNRSKAFGELPAESLAAWIQNLPQDEAARYVSLGLLERRFLDKRRPVDDLLNEFLIHAKAEVPDDSLTPEGKVQMIRRIFNTIGPNTTFDKVTQDDVKSALKKLKALTGRWKGQPISQKTNREYVFAVKCFCEWMVDTGRASVNPLRKHKAPSADGAQMRKRRPLEVEDFSRLMTYLCQAPLTYQGQHFDWTPKDRLMIYWTAVMTGFRMNELRSLTVAHLDFDCNPARLSVDGWVAKNGEQATIPISEDITFALREYTAHSHPNAPLLRVPNSTNAMTLAFYRDLDDAGVRRNFPNGAVVDFHTLRSTAIMWWLKYNKLSLPDVQFRARLKTLSLVQGYVDDYVPNYGDLIKDTPRVIDPGLPFRRVI